MFGLARTKPGQTPYRRSAPNMACLRTRTQRKRASRSICPYFGTTVLDDFHDAESSGDNQGSRSPVPVFMYTGATLVDNSNVAEHIDGPGLTKTDLPECLRGTFRHITTS
jgi:hypothetical protein